MTSTAEESVVNETVTWLKTRDENLFHALLRRMGKSSQYKAFLKRSTEKQWRRACSYWTSTDLKLGICVEVCFHDLEWHLERARFAFADDRWKARKAVRTLFDLYTTGSA